MERSKIKMMQGLGPLLALFATLSPVQNAEPIVNFYYPRRAIYSIKNQNLDI